MKGAREQQISTERLEKGLTQYCVSSDIEGVMLTQMHQKLLMHPDHCVQGVPMIQELLDLCLIGKTRHSAITQLACCRKDLQNILHCEEYILW